MLRKGTCIHFTGIQHEKCAAGVALKEVRDDSGPGRYRWPCITLANQPRSRVRCPQYRDPTEEEIAIDREAWGQALARVAAGRSPCCDAPLDDSNTVKGAGPRFCSKCKKLAFLGCNPSEARNG